MTDGRDPRVLLFATDPAFRPRLHVLADRVSELAGGPPPRVLGTEDVDAQDSAAVARWLDTQRVMMIVLAGDQLPAALITQARQRGIGLMLVDTKTPYLAGRRRLIPGATRALLNGFCEIHARDAAACGALKRLLRSEVPVRQTGELARYLPAPGCNTHELDSLRVVLGARPVWFAQDLPSEEFETVLLAHAHALRRAHRLLLIAKPRDPAQGAALAARALDVGFTAARRQLDDDIVETTQVYIGDADDEPGLFLRLAPVTYLGGTLTSGAAMPPALPPASLGSALLIGPQATADQTTFLEALVRCGGARRVGVPPALGEALAALLSPETGADAALKAWDLATAGSAATDTVAQAIVDWARERGTGS